MNIEKVKYEQNNDLCKKLVGSGDTILVYVSKDKYLGIGLSVKNNDSSKWKGSNYLGNTLTCIKNELILNLKKSIII